MKKRVLGIVLAGLMALSMAACGQKKEEAAPAADEKKTEAAVEKAAEEAVEEAVAEAVATEIAVSELKIGIIMKSSDEFQNAVVAGAKDAALAAGVKESNFFAVASTSESDSMQQVTAVEDMMANGVDILLNACQEENALKGALQNAVDAGIKVVMVDTDCAPVKGKVTYIGTDNYEAAYEGAKEFAGRLEKGSKVVILRGKLGDVNHEKRTEGLTEALTEAGMEVLEAQDANCETDKAAAAMEAFLTKYNNDIDAVMVTSDSMAVGAAQAIKGAGVQGIKICGFDGFQSAIALVETGEIEMIIAQQPYEIGFQGVECGLGALAGETYDEYIPAGIAIIDKDNVAEFKA